tara:strand:- start:840 stop:1379 length:540 start_codon:yes stop_codon:yes gene_type:complete
MLLLNGRGRNKMGNLFKVNLIPFNTRNTISFILLIASFILLYFGVTEPMMKISAEYAGQEVFKYKQSILEAVDTLYEGGYLLVAFLILFFSVMIPVFKGIVILWVFFFGEVNNKSSAHNFIFSIGRWSMADVFAVGVFIAYLGSKASNMLDATLEVGFYYFTGYCIVSLLSLQTKSKIG